MEYYFWLEFLYIFLHHIHMGVTCFKRLFISLQAKKRMKIDQVRSEWQLAKRCGGQNQKLQKLIFLDAELHWLHRCEKGVKCAVRLDQWWFLQLLILTPPLFNNVYLNNPLVTGVKKSLVLVPGTSKISGRTSICFHPMSGGQVKNSVQVYLTIYFGQVNWLQDK